MSPKLTLGYSTLAMRVGNIIFPLEREDWDCLVLIQNPTAIAWRGEGLASLIMREDVSLEELSTMGVAKSRNRAIWQAKGEYLVFSDDDIEFNVQGLETAIEYLDNHPELSLLLGQAKDPTGTLRKRYPKKPEKLTRMNSAKAATYEMIIRVEAIRQLGVFFDEEFGAGSKNYLGDEYIFIVDLLKAGGQGSFVPITIATHPKESSGSRWGTPEDRKARANVFSRVFGPLAPLIRLGFGVRRLRELGSINNLWIFVVGK
ncbi:glycosyltransferase family 2 protein [Candidatus Aquiluna sp. UB-MaderosW2red]|uniref:glycosyltransferase family 2 protein n=1 Tax=Candidatus Aquiluna sp. UB-MaderosW2red TaxID=1855377 RepID=UPI000875D124|nr:glycosyltransferase family 2 protein [Candidatus Aquiluna sp. UB-MaderosW2red]SCX06467.1 Glycosyl transferase family 2 [Candidatus Aquiluna sp. UB-MaderosW2red]